MNKVYCSTGAFITRKNNRDHRLLIKYSDILECDGFELMLYETWYDILDTIASDIKTAKVNVPVVHADKFIGELLSRNEGDDYNTAISNFEKNCILASEIGAKLLVLHLWGGIPSDKNIKFNFECYPLLNEIAKKYSLLLTIENVVCNQQNPMTHLNTLHSLYPDISFTFDTKMAAFHNEMDLLYEPEWKWLFSENFVRHIHLNDYAGGYKDWSNLRVSHPGEGHIDLERFFKHIKNLNYRDTFTLEATSVLPDGSIETDKLNKSLLYIKNSTMN